MTGEEYWYGWSIYFPEDYPIVYPTSVMHGQFHGQGSGADWHFHTDFKKGYYFYREVGKDDPPPMHFAPNFDGGRSFKLIPEYKLRGKWHKIEMHAKWSQGKDGFIVIYVNDEKKVDYKGPTLTGSYNYFKYGIYRSFLSRYYKENNVDEVPGQIVYYSNVQRGKIREEIQPGN